MNYKKVKEHLAKKEEAVKNIMEFLANENSYDDIMECLAITQTTVMKMADELNIYKKGRTDLEQFVIFFDIVQCLMITIKPLARIAEQEAEDGE
jgi:hypothetical protein